MGVVNYVFLEITVPASSAPMLAHCRRRVPVGETGMANHTSEKTLPELKNLQY